MTVGEGHTLVFNEAPLAILVIDREGHVVDANRAAVKTMARSRDRLVGTPVLTWVTPDDRDRAREQFVKAMDGRAGEWTVRIKRGDGATRAMSLRTVPIGKEGKAKGVLAFARDLTPSKEGRPDTDQLQSLLEHLPGQFVVALDRGGRIRYSSGLFRTLLVIDEDYVGEPFESLVWDDRRNDRLARRLVDDIDGGNDWGGLLWYRAADGTRVPARTYATPYRDPGSGRILGGLIAARDAREELKLRDRADRSRRLSSIGRLVGDAATTLALELGAAREGEHDANGDGEAESVAAAGSAGALDRLETFLGALGEFAGRPQRDFETVSIDDAVTQTLERHAGRIDGLAVEVARSNGDETRAYTDPERLGRALDIVVGNALESLDGQSEPKLAVIIDGDEESVVIRVSDSARTLDGGAVGTIFEPFFTTRPGRAGLGLPVARAIMDTFGGRIWAEVDEGWTTFVLELPRHGREAVIPFTMTPARRPRSRSVLIVDDEEAVRKSIRQFLERVGYEVREAWSGRSALAQVTAGDPPELILTDLQMSDGSGYWFLTEVSRDFPDLIRRTVIFTGDPESDDAARLLQDTSCPIIRKPVELSHLLEVLDEVALAS